MAGVSLRPGAWRLSPAVNEDFGWNLHLSKVVSGSPAVPWKTIMIPTAKKLYEHTK